VTPRRLLYPAAAGAAFMAGSWWWLVVFVPVAWAVCAYFWPFAPCWSCSGRKTNRGSTKRRFGKCRMCQGQGSRQVLGSKAVNRMVRSAVRYRSDRKVK
jgi:hypothetical protein